MIIYNIEKEEVFSRRSIFKKDFLTDFCLVIVFS